MAQQPAMGSNSHHNELLPHLFRIEYTKLTAVLCRLFGLQHIEIAEDIASDTFLKASELWPVQGLPQNPTAWLYIVAKNKTRDYLRRHALFEQEIKAALQAAAAQNGDDALIDFTPQAISDSQLAMMFAVCHPALAPEAQVCLALQVLCGFSVAEIAGAFLSNKETIKKRLFRARETLRSQQFALPALSPYQIKARLEAVLTTLYLLFNEGYFSRTAGHFIRKELCSDALRLAFLLTENRLTNTPAANALLALICYQSSRLAARVDEGGDGGEEAILFEEQDRSLWNRELIDRGNYYLVQSYPAGSSGRNEVSKYHLEVGIAYWHTVAGDDGKWLHILHLYDQLLRAEHSPAAALARTFAFARVHGPQAGIREAEALALTGSAHYYSLLGYLYKDIDAGEAAAHYRQAMALTHSAAERKQLQKAVERLKRDGVEKACPAG